MNLDSSVALNGSIVGIRVLSASGHIAFRAKLDAANDDVLFYGPVGNVALLLREGDPVPGGAACPRCPACRGRDRTASR